MAGYQPDNRPRLQAATRFFARPESFTLECPRCGEIARIRRGYPHPAWNPDISRFTCQNRQCGKTYVLGLLAWPVGGGPAAKTTPKDQIPSPRQLAQLRKEGGGWWLPDSEKQTHREVHESNITLEQERPDHDDDEDD